MFEQIFIESEYREHPRALSILERFSKTPVKEIDKIEDVFGRVKKPYLQKRDNLNLFIGGKRGNLIKEAPNAYGVKGEKHFYFIHAYNCPYECQYCYLQGYFNSPDLVFFINHEEIANEMKELCLANPNEKVWFHAGEFSDSLALSHVTGELPFYFETFKDLPNAVLELRTKSVNISELKNLSPLDNIIVTFSLSPESVAKTIDLKTPPLKTRLKAIKELNELGYQIGIHLDPIIYSENFTAEYSELISSLVEHLPAEKVEYLSIGVVRFTKDVYHQVENNYPTSQLLASEFQKTPEGLVRYPRPMRMAILNKVKALLLENGLKSEQVYLCMEDE